MTASECYRRLRDAGYGVKLGPRGGISYTGGNPPAELREYEGEWATWLRMPHSLRYKLCKQYPVRQPIEDPVGTGPRPRFGPTRQEVLDEYDRLFVFYMNSDAHCHMGAELAMQAAYREAGGK